MSATAAVQTTPQDLLTLSREAAEAAGALVAEATRRVRTRVAGPEGKLSAEKLETEQHAAHGLSWLATYGEAVRELAKARHRWRNPVWRQKDGSFAEW